LIEKIILTEEEEIFWEEISFSTSSYNRSKDEIKKSIEPAFKLLKSLIKRNVIPLIRLKYFTEPEFNIGGRGKSREATFVKNVIKEEDILKHHDFHKYLRYFIIGPELPSNFIKEFSKLVDNCQPVTSGDIESFYELACRQVRSNLFHSSFVSEEYYKLCLELKLGETMARIVRDNVKKLKLKN